MYSEGQFHEIKAKFAQVATYLSKLGHEKNEAEKTQRALEMQLHENEAIRRVVTKIMKVVDDMSIFWRKLDDALSEICKIMGAKYAVFATHEIHSRGKRVPIVRAVGNLDRVDFVGRAYPEQDPWFRRVLEKTDSGRRPWVVFPTDEHSVKGTLCYDIRASSNDRVLPGTAVLLPVDLGGETRGILIFLLDH